MLSKDQLQDVQGKDVVGSDGQKIGKVGSLYLDDETGQPEWVTVKTGLFGTNESFVPLANASVSADAVSVPVTKDQVKDAPNVGEGQRLSQEEEGQLYRHYGLTYAPLGGGDGYAERPGPSYAEGTTASDYGVGTTSGVHDRTGTEGVAGTGRADVPGDDAMTRSEEQLRVGTERRESGRVRLRKYVVTENVTTTVPVEREEVRVEREPITDANRDEALAGPDISEAEHEVVLTEERPVVEKEAVPVERVRLETDTVTGEEQVSEEVRKERIETEGDVEGRR